MCCIYIYTIYRPPPLFPLPPGGCPSQAVVMNDRYTTQPARLLNGPACLPCMIACDCMRAVYIRHIDNYSPSESPTTPIKQALNATKYLFCCVRSLRHVFYPGITACNDDFGLAGPCFCPASLVNIFLCISEALFQ